MKVLLLIGGTAVVFGFGAAATVYLSATWEVRRYRRRAGRRGGYLHK